MITELTAFWLKKLSEDEVKFIYEVEVPMAEMFKYATDLRSITQGRGNFDMTFERYEEVPPNEASKIIENSK